MTPFIRQPPNWDSARDTDPYYVDPEDEENGDVWDDDSIPVNIYGETDDE